jgi:transposase-like protein
MKYRKWTSQEKLKIVLEGLSGQIEIGKLCSKYQVAQTQYYKWRDQLLKFGYQAFDQKTVTNREERQASEIKKLKTIIGEMAIELKKSELELRELES